MVLVGPAVEVASASRLSGRWTIQPTPHPVMTGSFLCGVSCTSATACSTVGRYSNTAGTDLALAERWNGTEWTIQGYRRWNYVNRA